MVDTPLRSRSGIGEWSGMGGCQPGWVSRSDVLHCFQCPLLEAFEEERHKTKMLQPGANKSGHQPLNKVIAQ